MLTLPDAILPVLHPFATLFRSPTWLKAQILLVGAILAPGQRTVAAALRVMGLSNDRNYARYHQVLNRAVWSPRQAAGILLVLLLQHLDQGDGPLIFGIDETLERRRGPKIKSPGHLPRCGALQPVSGGQGQRPALDLPDVAGPGPLGGTLLGLALSHCAGALGTLPPAARTPPQKAHRLGAADDPATAPLAAAAPPGAGGRQQLRRAGPAPLLPIVGATRYPHRPLAPGRRPL